MTDTGKIKIHGKDYETVAHRIHRFREAHPWWPIRTTIVVDDGEQVVFRAEVWAGDEKSDLYCLTTGHASERYGSSQINRTSALENCETSAIGRALAAAGFGGTEFASANEVQNAIHQQEGEPFRPTDSPPPGSGTIQVPQSESMFDRAFQTILGADSIDETDQCMAKIQIHQAAGRLTVDEAETLRRAASGKAAEIRSREVG